MVRQPKRALAFSLLRLLDCTRLNTTHSVEILWKIDWPVAGTATSTATSTTHDTPNRLIPMLPTGFEAAYPASEWPHSDALDSAANGIGPRKRNKPKNTPN